MGDRATQKLRFETTPLALEAAFDGVAWPLTEALVQDLLGRAKRESEEKAGE